MRAQDKALIILVGILAVFSVIYMIAESTK